MSERLFLENFAVLAEMKKVELEPAMVISKWEIQDEIVQVKEKLHDWMVQLKIANNQITRAVQCRQVTEVEEGQIIRKKVKDMLEQPNMPPLNHEMAILKLHFENQYKQKILYAQEEEEIAKIGVDTYTTKQVQEIYANYQKYEDRAHEFLQRINYLKTGYKSNDTLTIKNILTSEEFYRYLVKLFDQILYHSRVIMRYRLDKKSERYYRGVKLQVNPLYAHNTIFPHSILWSKDVQKYQVVFGDTTTRYDQSVKEFSILTNKLYLLLMYVKDTSKYLNIIIQSHNQTNQLNTYISNMEKNWQHFLSQEFNRLPMLPTNFTEYFSSFFYQTDINGNPVWSISRLYRYMIYDFSQNKEMNNLRKFIHKSSKDDSDSEGNVDFFDYITFLFGEIA